MIAASRQSLKAPPELPDAMPASTTLNLPNHPITRSPDAPITDH